MNRRSFLTLMTILPLSVQAARASGTGFEITRTEAEWRQRLSVAEYRVMREEATERAFSSPLDKTFAPGTYLCRGCDLPLYAAADKYDSGTGWPSFTRSLPDAVATRDDTRFFMRRTEVHCRRCGSHLGHVFDDGPAPTGKRHCLNGVSLRFVPA